MILRALPEAVSSTCERQSGRVENMSNRAQTAGEKRCQGLEFRRKGQRQDQQVLKRASTDCPTRFFRIDFSPMVN